MGTIYYPYLRGRQFELLALRELTEKGLIGDHVVPIIEPLKATKVFLKTMSTLVKNKKTFCLVMNPEYGEFEDQLNSMPEEQERFCQLLEDPSCIRAYLMKKDAPGKMSQCADKAAAMTISTKRDDLKPFSQIYGEDNEPKYALIPDDRVFRRRIHDGRILFQDHFNAAKRNVDYLEREDEFFTDDHIYAETEGYTGVADYSVVGSEYSTSGFAPVAVAIHIVYPSDNGLRIRHFVSDSNEGIENPAGKFGEAVNHLTKWYNTTNDSRLATEGLNSLVVCSREKRYPGLGTVKKFSIMHHLELMERLLGEKTSC